MPTFEKMDEDVLRVLLGAIIFSLDSTPGVPEAVPPAQGPVHDALPHRPRWTQPSGTYIA